MKCPNCGTELTDGVLFCRDCGARVAPKPQKKRRCQQCGFENESDAKFCTNCGVKLSVALSTSIPPSVKSIPINDKAPSAEIPDEASGLFYQTRNEAQPVSNNSSDSKKLSWSSLDLFTKIAGISLLVFILVLIIAILTHKGIAIFFSIVQIGGIIVAILLHKSIIKSPHDWLRYVVLSCTMLFTVLTVMSFFWGTKTKKATTKESKPLSTNAVVDTATAKPSPTPKAPATPTAKPEACDLLLEIDFKENYLFSKYDVDLYLDDEYVGTLPHGKFFTSIQSTQTGQHTVLFKEVGGSNRGKTTVELLGDSTFSCRIEVTSMGIDVNNEEILQSIRYEMITMPNCVDKLFSEANDSLKKLGFVNISYETTNGKIILDYDNWLVQAQDVPEGKEVPKSEVIQLTCISLDDYFSAAYVGKTVNEIQDHASTHGFSIQFRNGQNTDVTDQIQTMDQAAKKDWIATKARQHGGILRKAVVTIEHVSSFTSSSAPKATTETKQSVTTTSRPAITAGQENALRSAKNYLKLLSFSYKELVEQLEYDQYTHEEAVYAADNCGADWNEQAVRSAQSYLRIFSYSKKGLIEQLEYDGFTHEQAVYAAEQLGY